MPRTLLALVLALGFPALAEAKMAIVIMDPPILPVDGKPDDWVRASELATGFRSAGRYTPVAQKTRDRALKHKSWDVTGCTSEHCILNAAKELGVARLAAIPSIKQENVYFKERGNLRNLIRCEIRLAIYDLKTGKDSRSVERQVTCQPTHVRAQFKEMVGDVGRKQETAEVTMANVVAPSRLSLPAKASADMDPQLLVNLDKVQKLEVGALRDVDIVSYGVEDEKGRRTEKYARLPYVTVAAGLAEGWQRVAAAPAPNPFREYAEDRSLTWAKYVDVRVPMLIKRLEDEKNLVKVLTLDTFPLEEKRKVLTNFTDKYGDGDEVRDFLYENPSLWPLIDENPKSLVKGEWVASYTLRGRSDLKTTAKFTFDEFGAGTYVIDDVSGVRCTFPVETEDGTRLLIHYDFSKCKGKEIELFRQSSLALPLMANEATTFTHTVRIVERRDRVGRNGIERYFEIKTDPDAVRWDQRLVEFDGSLGLRIRRWRFNDAYEVAP